MDSYESKKSIDINRDSGIVTDEDHQFLSIDDLDKKFNRNYQQQTVTGCNSTNSVLERIQYDRDEDGDTILHLAVVGCVPEVVEDLIRRCDLNATNNMKQTPLHVASMANRPEMVELLLNGGARIDVHDWRGNTPLHLACERGFSEVAVIIIETLRVNDSQNENSNRKRYLELKNFDGKSCLHMAAAQNRLNIIDLLINRYNIDLNCQDSKSGATIIHDAIAKFNDELVRYILSCSQNKHCNRTDYYGRSPLDLISLLQKSRLNQVQLSKLNLINELVRERIKFCIAQDIGCCTANNLRLNEAILDSSSSSDYTDSDSDVSY